ncbi:MAG: nucleotidyl transferase AbiEii/AbiGii toxin family protein [Acidobacteria bacterium]|nr:nucleotidyl transferase AbiEii/AbiGii toxin family protein [Acidobacteriota bacterium]
MNAHRVRFVVVGAYAVAFHAKPRYTKDIDIFVATDAENARRLVAALEEFGFGSESFCANDFMHPGRIVQLGFPPSRIDLLTSIDGVTFEEAWTGRVEGHYGATEVWYLGRDELIRNKRDSGRPQDLIDLEWLES